MNFSRLIREISEGKKLARTSWSDKSILVLMHPLTVGAEKTLCVYNAEGDKMYHPWMVREEDMSGEDWEIVHILEPAPIVTTLKNIAGATPVSRPK